jgi:RNA polymerase sigma factor (sigma-70 family)
MRSDTAPARPPATHTQHRCHRRRTRRLGLGSAAVDAPSDAELVERVRAHDPEGWRLLVERYSGRVWAVARSQGLDRERAADVAQTVWLNLLHGADKVREPNAIAAWLVTVARREAIRVDRLSKRALPVDDEHFDRQAAPGVDHDHAAILDADGAVVRRSMAQLGDRCRELLQLLYSSDELSYTEISSLLDMPIGSIGPTRARCLDRLRTIATAEGLTR